MAINPILPILIGAIKTRNTIKDRNEEAYDEATGNFIDIASAEFFRDQTEQKKIINFIMQLKVVMEQTLQSLLQKVTCLMVMIK